MSAFDNFLMDCVNDCINGGTVSELTECFICGAEKPDAEMEAVQTYHGTLEQPPEYEPVCADCWEAAS